MLNVKLFQMESFLPASYEEKLAPRMQLAHEQLQNGTGAGGSFTGWVHLPRDYDKEEFRRIQAAAARENALGRLPSQATRPWLASSTALPSPQVSTAASASSGEPNRR